MKNDIFGQIGEIIIFTAILGVIKVIDGKFNLGLSLGAEIVLSAIGVAIYVVLKYKYKKSKNKKEDEIKRKIEADERFKD
ncbi:MAG: hypothetical protein ACRC28_04685 [Clostridium sp.]|uniref:hypothetical protein n=1 Tax=Clostridium sp. TaxID=1506 RepID=UPI003F2E19B3